MRAALGALRPSRWLPLGQRRRRRTHGWRRVGRRERLGAAFVEVTQHPIDERAIPIEFDRVRTAGRQKVIAKTSDAARGVYAARGFESARAFRAWVASLRRCARLGHGPCLRRRQRDRKGRPEGSPETSTRIFALGQADARRLEGEHARRRTGWATRTPEGVREGRALSPSLPVPWTVPSISPMDSSWPTSGSRWASGRPRSRLWDDPGSAGGRPTWVEAQPTGGSPSGSG